MPPAHHESLNDAQVKMVTLVIVRSYGLGTGMASCWPGGREAWEKADREMSNKGK